MSDLTNIERQVMSLSLEDRAVLVDSLLRSLNLPESDFDKQWAALAQKRIAELRSGKVKAIPGEKVIERVRARFEK